MYYYSREKEEKRKHRRERERSERFFFFLAQKPNNVVLIKSSRAHSARHEFISFTIHLVIIIAKKKRELSFVTRSLSLCVLVVVVCFHFSPTKVGVRYKNKNSLPSSLSLVWTKVYAHHRLKCYNCVIKGLHEYFIRMVKGNYFVIIAARCLFFVHTRERERERERERKRKKEKSAQKRRRRKFCIYKIRETWKKNKSLLLLFCRDSRERDRLRNPATYMITQFCQNFWKDLLVIIIA